MHQEQYEDMRSIIYDHLMQGAIAMVTKLDIGYTIKLPAKVEVANEGEKKEQDSKEQEKASATAASKKGKEKEKEEDDKPKEDTSAANESEDSEDNAGAVVDPTMFIQNLRLNVPKDYELFVNLVEFCKLVLPISEDNKYEERDIGTSAQRVKMEQSTPTSEGIDDKTAIEVAQEVASTVSGRNDSATGWEPGRHFFSRWVYLLGKEIVARSNAYPLVAGFYKLLSIVFTNCEKMSYFQGVNADNDQRAREDEEAVSQNYCVVHFIL
jgi:hypothetical protein